MNFTSVRSGTRRTTQGSFVRSVAAMSGRTEFFAPLIVTSPCRGVPPLIIKLSIAVQENRTGEIVNHSPARRETDFCLLSGVEPGRDHLFVGVPGTARLERCQENA